MTFQPLPFGLDKQSFKNDLDADENEFVWGLIMALPVS